MGNQQGNFLTAIDVGSAKTCALVAEMILNSATLKASYAPYAQEAAALCRSS